MYDGILHCMTAQHTQMIETADYRHEYHGLALQD